MVVLCLFPALKGSQSLVQGSVARFSRSVHVESGSFPVGVYCIRIFLFLVFQEHRSLGYHTCGIT